MMKKKIKESDNLSFSFRNVLLYLFFLGLFFIIIDCFARAGGGFSGGSFSGSGGGGGEAQLIYFLIQLSIRYPQIGLPLLAATIFVMYYTSKKAKDSYYSYTIKKNFVRQNLSNVEDKIQKLQNRDLEFDKISFLKKCGSYFLKIQKAWSDRNLKEARLLLSDGVYSRFSTYLEIQKSTGIQNKVENVEIINSEIVAVESDQYFDTIHVAIEAKALDYFISNETNTYIYGNKTPQKFVEYWSFLRRPGVKTLNKKSLIDNSCPNCAAPIEISDSTVCKQCNSVVNSGDYDWVLAEITQEENWRGVEDKTIEGLSEIQQKDAAFNIQHIEDLTSVMFWKIRETEYFNDKKYLLKLCDSGFASRFMVNRNQLNTNNQFYADAVLSSVDVLYLKTQESTKENMDEVYVKITWSGHPELKKSDYIKAPDYQSSKVYYHEFILHRQSDVKTKSAHTLSSNHCIGCGAAKTISLKPECDYCGLSLNDGSSEWVLKDIRPYLYQVKKSIFVEDRQKKLEQGLDASIENELMEKKQFSYETNIKLFCCLISAMNADDVISPSELELLYIMSKNRKIPRKEVDTLIESVRKKEIIPEIPSSLEERNFFFKTMIKMCLMDGKVDLSERKLLKQLFNKFGYMDYDINYMIKKEKTMAYRIARLNLKDLKKSKNRK